MRKIPVGPDRNTINLKYTAPGNVAKGSRNFSGILNLTGTVSLEGGGRCRWPLVPSPINIFSEQIGGAAGPLPFPRQTRGFRRKTG